MCWTTAHTLDIKEISGGSCEIKDFCLDRSKMPFSEIIRINRESLLHIFSECTLLACANAPGKFDDPLTDGLRTYCKNQFKSPISISLVFSAQMVSCANAILGTEGTRPFEDMQTAARRADELIRNYENSGMHQVDCSNPETCGIIRDFSRVIRDLMLDDYIAHLKTTRNDIRQISSNRPGRPNRPIYPSPPFHLHKLNPLACGTKLLAVEVFLKGWGAALSQSLNTCLQAAHFYHTTRLLTSLDVRWRDIESFISLHSSDSLFAGRVPTTMEECLTR